MNSPQRLTSACMARKAHYDTFVKIKPLNVVLIQCVLFARLLLVTVLLAFSSTCSTQHHFRKFGFGHRMSMKEISACLANYVSPSPRLLRGNVFKLSSDSASTKTYNHFSRLLFTIDIQIWICWPIATKPLRSEAQLRSARVSSGRIEMRTRGLERRGGGVNTEDDEEYTLRHTSGSHQCGPSSNE